MSTYNLHFFQPIFSFGLDRLKIASGKLAIPLLYGMIYRQLPDIEKAASAKIKMPCRIQSAKADLTGSKAYL
jgi:hypothetical protein